MYLFIHRNATNFCSYDPSSNRLTLMTLCDYDLVGYGSVITIFGDPKLSNYTPQTTKLLGGILVSLRPSVHPSVRPSVPPRRVGSVTSTVLDRFFPYYPQMITTMRGCVADNDLWPWPISSRSFGLDLENRVRSVAFTVLDGFFLFLAQMITIIRGCIESYVFFRICNFEFKANFWHFSALTLKKKIYSSRGILSIFDTNDH